MQVDNSSNSVQQAQQAQQAQQTQNDQAKPKQNTGNLAGISVQQTKPTDEAPDRGCQNIMVARKASADGDSPISARQPNSTQSNSIRKAGDGDDDRSTTKGSLLDRAKSVSDPDDSGIKGAAGGASTSASNTPHLVNNGGKVLSSPSIDNIYLGSYYSTTQGKADAAHQDGAAKAWVTSGNEGILKQYGVGQGSFVGSHTVAGAAPKSYTAADVEKLVQKEIASGKSPQGDQTIHTVYLPPGSVLKDGDASSANGLGGFHGSYTDKASGKEVYYAVIAYNKGNNGIDFTGKPQDNNSITASHEWSEAATDPRVADVNRGAPSQGTLGYYDNQYGEIGDIAINISKDPSLGDVWGKEGNYAFQKEWSNKDNTERLT